MRKLKVGDIYYWCISRDTDFDRFCVVTIVNTIDYRMAAICGRYTYSCLDFQSYDYIVESCMHREIKAGRLHYIGRV